MQIPFHHFEQYIDETILKRGLSYFENGFVNPVEEITPGVYETLVEGTEAYRVQLKIDNEIITDYSCTCPFDSGPVCKHVAAVIFYLHKEHLEIKPAGKRKKSSGKGVKKKTIIEQVNELLEKIPDNELKDFIRNNTVNDAAFRNIFLSAFAHINSDESKELYAKQVRTILRSSAGRHGMIDYYAARYVGRAVAALLNAAQNHFDQSHFKSAMLICSAIMEEMTAALQFADDSNGDIGGNIDAAYSLLVQISEEKIPEEIRSGLFQYGLESFRQNIFHGWDWHFGMADLASGMVKTETEARQLLSVLSQRHENEYDSETAQRIKLNVLLNTGKEKEAGEFLEKHIANPSFRTAAIKKAMEQKNYDRAIALANDGVRLDLKNKPGLAMDWYDWLLRIAIKQKDSEKIIMYARILFTDSIRDKKEYYSLMKSNVAKEQWNHFAEGLVADLAERNRWAIHEIAAIYINEEWWNKLLDLIKQNPSLQTIENYEKHLSKNFSEELAELYEREILEFMNRNTGRNHYQTACKYLRRMKKLGAGERAGSIISTLRSRFPQRKALMEELEKV